VIQLEYLKRLARKLGLWPYLMEISLWPLKPFFKYTAMRFPTFSSDIHSSIIPHSDYFRQATLGLAIQRVLSESVEGSFAEVGVYRGDVSKFVHKLAPNRPYYLFDTFEGFPKEDLEENSLEDNRFRDTSVEIVLRNIGDQDNINIRKGYVPATLKGLEDEKFAFVLLDLDLYKPTLRSLEFFYPRVSKGGYLFIHDYNSPESNWACNRAVNEFMKDKSEKVIEIADKMGTVMFRKL
jgi:O-methyltransferase